MKPKRRKPRVRMLRWRKLDHVHNLYSAVQRYVHANGGSLLVTGGVEVQDFHEGMDKFKIAVRCLGRKPVFQIPEDDEAGEAGYDS